MKDFDYEKAKAGAPVCTRDGRPARIICWDADIKYDSDKYQIVALVRYELSEGNTEEAPVTYNMRGEEVEGKKNSLDLMMAPVKHEGWVLIHPAGPQCIAHIYNSKEEAEEDAEREIIAYSAVAKIEWEE